METKKEILVGLNISVITDVEEDGEDIIYDRKDVERKVMESLELIIGSYHAGVYDLRELPIDIRFVEDLDEPRN